MDSQQRTRSNATKTSLAVRRVPLALCAVVTFGLGAGVARSQVAGSQVAGPQVAGPQAAGSQVARRSEPGRLPQRFDRTRLPSDIIFRGPGPRPIHGVRCATRPVGELEAELIEAQLRAWRAEQRDFMPRQVAIPVAFHVVTDGGTGDVSDSQISDQVSVLNDALSGSGFSFSLDSIDRTDDGSWYSGCAGAQESAMKSALAVDTSTTLNIYTCEPSGGILGYAYLAGDLGDGDTDDGVVLLHSTLPGGSAAPYNAGDTATHEVGHYLGLLHTFDGGCDDGDEVSDTPAEADPAYGCPTGRDSCADVDGLDPIENFMDYTDDACMDRFSSGQSTRMNDMVGAFRPNLGSGGGGGGGDGGDDGGDDDDGGGDDDDSGGSVPGVPSPVSPSGTLDDADPTYTWTEASGDNLSDYQIQVRRGSSLVLDDQVDTSFCGGGTCSLTPSSSLGDNDYTWQVRAMNDIGWGDWSGTMSFSVDTSIPEPNAPALQSPSGTIDETLPTFTWAVTTPEVTAYQLLVRNSSDKNVHNEVYGTGICGSSTCSAAASEALEQDTHTWQVRAQNETGWSDWSALQSFSVEVPDSATVPSAPSGASPSGSLDASPTAFVWSPISNEGVSQYQVSVASSGSGQVHEDFLNAGSCAGASCTLTSTTALADGNYTWEVRALNEVGWGDWSSPLAFSVDSAPSAVPTAPAGVSPSGTLDASPAAYVWAPIVDEGVTRYQISIVAQGGGKVFEAFLAAGSCASEACTLVPTTSLADGTYEWDVRGENTLGWGTWNSALSFTVASDGGGGDGDGGDGGGGGTTEPPGRPVLDGPSGNISDNRPTFTWSADEAATEYRVEVKRKGSGIVHSATYSAASICGTSECELSAWTALPDSRYVWRVRAANDIGTSRWSRKGRFRVR